MLLDALTASRHFLLAVPTSRTHACACRGVSARTRIASPRCVTLNSVSAPRTELSSSGMGCEGGEGQESSTLQENMRRTEREDAHNGRRPRRLQVVTR